MILFSSHHAFCSTSSPADASVLIRSLGEFAARLQGQKHTESLYNTDKKECCNRRVGGGDILKKNNSVVLKLFKVVVWVLISCKGLGL